MSSFFMTEPQAASATALALEETTASGGGERLPVLANEAPWPVALAALLLALGLVFVFYADMGRELVQVWSVDPNYSHGFLVPAASLMFAALAWRQFGLPVRQAVDRKDLAIGAAEVLAGLALSLPAWLLSNLLFGVVSLVCVLRGLLLMLGGGPANRAYGFAALFLIFMAPLPMSWYQPIAIVMQQLVSGVSTELLEIFGIPAYREGYFIHLPGYTMEVGEACSGLRQLTAILALSVAIGYLGHGGAWSRWTLALLAVPIAIFANCLRVMLTGGILMAFGPKWAEGVYHTLEGLVMVGVGAGLVLGAAWGLSKIEKRLKQGGGQSEPA